MKTIVLIDDEKGILELMSYEIKEHLGNKIKIIEYSNPLNFIEDYDDLNIDLIISDVRMPELTGIELHNKILKKGYSKSFIFNTGFLQDCMKDLYQINNCYFFEKPTNFSLLLKTISNIFTIEDKITQVRESLIISSSTITFSEFQKKYKIYQQLVRNIKLKQLTKEKLAS